MRLAIVLLLLNSTLWAQAGDQPATGPTQAVTAPQSTDSPDDLAQMRTDLNHMESLLNNMSSEITFLRDQNLQILLNTNARMWTILIRDMRMQLDREQQRRSGVPPPAPPSPAQSRPHP